MNTVDSRYLALAVSGQYAHKGYAKLQEKVVQLTGRAGTILAEDYPVQWPFIVCTINKPQTRNIITGPCLIPSVDIRSANGRSSYQATTDWEIFSGLIGRAPTFQNVVCMGYPLTGSGIMVLETEEYAHFNDTFCGEVVLPLVCEGFERIRQMAGRYQQRVGSEAELVPWETHLKEHTALIEDSIEEIIMDYPEVRQRTHDIKNPKRFMRLRVEATYTPQFARRVFGAVYDGYTVVENVDHLETCLGNDYLEPVFRKAVEDGEMNAVCLRPPVGLDMAEEMDNSKPLYLGDTALLREQLGILATTNGGLFTDPVANYLLWFDYQEDVLGLQGFTNGKKIKKGKSVGGQYRSDIIEATSTAIALTHTCMLQSLRKELALLIGEDI